MPLAALGALSKGFIALLQTNNQLPLVTNEGELGSWGNLP